METTWARAVEDYLADCRRRGLRPATLRYYADALDRFERCARPTTLQDLDLVAFRSFADTIARHAPVSVRGWERALLTFARWLTDEGLVSSNPLVRWRLPKVDTPVVIAPTDAQLVAFAAALSPRMRIVVLALAGTGLRIGELSRLCMRDWQDEVLAITLSKNRTARLVVIDPILGALLRLLTDELADLSRHDDDALFFGERGARVSPGGARHAMQDASTRRGLQVTPHRIRHWFCRNLAAHGTSERLLAARMGWRQNGLVERYAPVGEAELRGDVARYAPLVRLASDGLLGRLVPPRVLRVSDASALAYAARSPRIESAGRAAACARRSCLREGVQ